MSALVIRPDMLDIALESIFASVANYRVESDEIVEAHISGSFCVSMTAAMGMPKFETGPQKSTVA